MLIITDRLNEDLDATGFRVNRSTKTRCARKTTVITTYSICLIRTLVSVSAVGIQFLLRAKDTFFQEKLQWLNPTVPQ